jgi:hypothetical protein
MALGAIEILLMGCTVQEEEALVGARKKRLAPIKKATNKHRIRLVLIFYHLNSQDLRGYSKKGSVLFFP